MKKTNISIKKSLPLVTIAIPALNSAKSIEKTLKSIVRQTYPNIEIIVADGYSKDETVSIAKKYNATICFAKELGRARFEAFKRSKGTFILALDSDQFMGKHAIEKFVRIMTKKQYDALILNEISIPKKGTLVEKLIGYERWFVNAGRDANPFFGGLSPRFFLKKKLLAIKWPKTLSILDVDVIHKEFTQKNNRIAFIEGDCIRHHEVDSWTVLFKKFIAYGKNYIPAMRVSPKITFFHSLPRRIYFSKLAFSKPHVLLGLTFLYVFKGIAVLTGIAMYLFTNLLLPSRKNKV